jgi:hypothetical protein
MNISPPVNCGVYLFSVRLFEEFGLSRVPDGATYPDTSSNIMTTPRGGIHTAGNSTPKEMRNSIASATGSEFAKVFA